MNQAPDAVGTADAKSQPKWMNPIIVAAMVLGSLFGCCGITSVGGAAVGRDVSVATLEVQAQSAKDPAAAEMIRRSAKLQKAFQDRTYPLSMTVAVIGLLQSLALGIAGSVAGHAGFSRGPLMADFLMTALLYPLVRFVIVPASIRVARR